MKIKILALLPVASLGLKSAPGDIFRDNYGGTVTIKSVAGRCVTYRREGYEYDCVMPVYQFRRDFSLAETAPRQTCPPATPGQWQTSRS